MSLLGKITKGRIKKPARLLIYGEPGVGKSTFAAGAPDPLFIDVEKRTEHLDVKRIEVDSWPQVLGIMGEVLQAEEKPCKTLVFDTVDHMEFLIFDYLCKQEGVDSIDDVGGGYGKGYTAALNQWRRFVNGLEKLREAGIPCILVAHAHKKVFKNPEGEDYDQWQMKMNTKAADFLREKMDAMGFAKWDDVAHVDKKTKKVKGVTTGERLLCFGHAAGYESKHGLNLPDEMPLEWDALQEALKNTGEVS